MSENLKGAILDLKTGIIEDAMKPSGGAAGQNITINDAASETAKILIPNFGSDRDYLEEGKVDVRRFSDISEVDVFWLTYFMEIDDDLGGEYTKKFCNNYLNLRYSVKGKHKKQTINMQNAVRGMGDDEEEDSRNWLQRNVTQRGEAD